MDISPAKIQGAAWAPPDRRPIWEWAKENIELPGAYAKGGPLDLRQSPWLKGPLESLCNHRVQKVNSLKGLQSGGSLVGEIYAMYRIDQDPGPMMWNFQTEAIRDKTYRTRLLPLFKMSPCTRDILPDDRRALSHGIISFPGCDVTIQGGGHNESNLQTLSYQILINDEVWQWEPGMLYQAEGRADAFKSAKKIYNISQGCERESDWDIVFHEGIVQELVVHCPECREWHPLIWAHRMDDASWAGVSWDRRTYMDGRVDIGHAQQTAHYRCPLCGYHHPTGEAAMKKLVNTCRYSTEYPDAAYHGFELPERVENDTRGVPSIHSYHWNSLVSVPLADLVKEWLTADAVHKRGSLHLKKEFMQKKLAVFYSDEMTEERIELQLSGYQLGDTYPGETHRFMTVDAQEGRGDDNAHFWVVLRGWIYGSGSSGLVWAGRVETEDDLVELTRTHGVPPKHVSIDGGNDTRRIAAMCARHGWRFLKGDDKEHFAHHLKRGRARRKVDLPYSNVQHYNVRKGQGPAAYVKWMLWSNPTVKDLLHRLRHGHGVPWELPIDVPDFYKDQIDSEQRIKIQRGSRWGWRWVPKKKSNPNNHLWDCECMQVVMALVAGVLPFDADLAPEVDAEDQAKAAEKKAKAASRQKDDRQLELVTEG